MGRYYKLNEDDKTSDIDLGSFEMPEGGSRYREDTPSFESLYAGNAGRGVQGQRGLTVGLQEYDRNKKKPAKKYASGGSVSASSRADGIAQRGKTKGRMC
jgi:hypothetical protein